MEISQGPVGATATTIILINRALSLSPVIQAKT